MCESLGGEWALCLTESALASAVILENHECYLSDWIIWGQCKSLGTQCRVRPAETRITHLFSSTAHGTVRIYWDCSSHFHCFSFLAVCQRKCTSMAVATIDMQHLQFWKKVNVLFSSMMIMDMLELFIGSKLFKFFFSGFI